jgi:hypothetical protein
MSGFSAFPITHTEIEKPRWHDILKSTLVCKYSSHKTDEIIRHFTVIAFVGVNIGFLVSCHGCDNNGKAINPQIVVDYNRHMGYVDKGDRMASPYSINRRTWMWTEKLFFHLFDQAIMNSYILLCSCGKGKGKGFFKNK